MSSRLDVSDQLSLHCLQQMDARYQALPEPWGQAPPQTALGGVTNWGSISFSPCHPFPGCPFLRLICRSISPLLLLHLCLRQSKRKQLPNATVRNGMSATGFQPATHRACLHAHKCAFPNVHYI